MSLGGQSGIHLVLGLPESPPISALRFRTAISVATRVLQYFRTAAAVRTGGTCANPLTGVHIILLPRLIGGAGVWPHGGAGRLIGAPSLRFAQ